MTASLSLRASTTQPLTISLLLALLCIFIASLNTKTVSHDAKNKRWQSVSRNFKSEAQKSNSQYNDLMQLGLSIAPSDATINGKIQATAPYHLFDRDSLRFSVEGIDLVQYFANRLKNNHLSLNLVIAQGTEPDVTASHISALRAILDKTENNNSYISITSAPIQGTIVIFEASHAR
jgi:hypothetical protein